MNKTISFKIKDKLISDSNPCFILGEIGQTHNGSIEKVFKLIDEISKTGCDAVKFQMHFADEESTLDEKFRVKIKNYKSRYDYWKSVEFSFEEWFKIKKYCEKKNIFFISSVFSIKGVDFLKKIKVPAWKIPSGEYESDDILNEIYKTNLPVLFSTGMMSLNEINSLHYKLNKKKIIHSILHCVSSYPLNLKKVGLNNIKIFKKKFNCPIGYSDHSGNISTLITAMVMGSNILETHIKIGDNDKGPDSSSSINIKKLEDLCKFRDDLFILNNNLTDKKKLPKDVIKMKSLFGKSLTLKNDLEKGSYILENNLTFKKPGTGYKKSDIKKFIGKKVNKFVSSKRVLKKGDIE
jgi:N-acetylneuraminate synthase